MGPLNVKVVNAEQISVELKNVLKTNVSLASVVLASVVSNSVTITRRDFITKLLQAGCLCSCGVTLACSTFSSGRTPLLLKTEDQILISLLECLYPVDSDISGPDKFLIKNYIHQAFLDPAVDTEIKHEIYNGLHWLDEESVSQLEKSFIQLNFKQQNILLSSIQEENWGESFLASVLGVVLEGLFADPVYGANPQGVNWKTYQHSPGYPRPQKPYYEA